MAAGALTRTGIGLILNPLTIVKARFEVGPELPFSTGMRSLLILINNRVIIIRITGLHKRSSRFPRKDRKCSSKALRLPRYETLHMRVYSWSFTRALNNA